MKGTLTVTDRMGRVITREAISANTSVEAKKIRDALLRAAIVKFPDHYYFTNWKQS